MLLGRVVDQDVDPAECLHDPPGGLAAKVGIADVTGDRDAPAAFALHLFARFVGVFMLVEIHDGDVRAFLGKGDGDRPPDPAVTPGDDGRLPLQFVGAPVLSALRIGERLHLRLVTWPLLLVLRGPGGLFAAARHDFVCPYV